MEQTDSFFDHRLEVAFTFHPTDDVEVHWRLRAPDYQRWGANAGGDNFTQGSSNAATVYTRSIYATISQDWGKLSVGRLEEDAPTSQAGLRTLGYAYGGDYIYAMPFDYSEIADGILYQYSQGEDSGFGINVYYVKSDTLDVNNNWGFNDADVDRDRYGVEPFFKWNNGGATLALEYERDMTDQNARKNYSFFINPAIMQTWGPFSLRFEGKIGWGKTEYNWAGDNAIESQGLGLYLEANYNYGAGDINLITWYADGSSIDEAANPWTRTQHDLVNMGDFAPFLVAYYGTTLGDRVSMHDDPRYGAGPLNNGAEGLRDVQGGGNNHWGIGILGNHSFTDSIKFNYGIGYMALVEQYYEGQKKDLGVEVDVGVHIDLLDNVSFETQFGYMFNGKAYRDFRVDVNGDPIDFRDPKDTYAWLSALTFSF
jgi:hypothetical protein